jgi:hypothetical protein
LDNSRILIVPDLHFPYCHVDALDFLHKIKKNLCPTRIICLGDELDYHAMSFHDSDPDLESSGRELALGLGYIDTLHELFPKMDLLHSNHGSMAYRKAKHHGMPRHLLKSYNDVLGVPTDDWRWHGELILELPNGLKCKFVHGISANILAASQSCGMSLVQGHHHSLFELRYWSAGNGLHFAITSGCLIDDASMAFAYNKLQVKRPIMGVTFIENSIPTLIPMLVDENNRWIGTKVKNDN